MGRRIVPDPAEIRDQIQRLRDGIADWQTLIEKAQARIARLSGWRAANPPQADERSRDDGPRDKRKPTAH